MGGDEPEYLNLAGNLGSGFCREGTEDGPLGSPEQVVAVHVGVVELAVGSEIPFGVCEINIY